jgi:ABC-type siderophore export system fused ATPase/permease subunit
VNEEQRVNTSKTELPIRTLIAALWLVVIGVILTTWHLVALFISFSYSLDAGTVDERGNNLVLILLLGSILYILSGFFLPIRSKWAWISAVITLAMVSICSIGIYLYYLSSSVYYYSIIPIIVYVTPVVLILLDRKKYFEMIRQRQLNEKNKNDSQS